MFSSLYVVVFICVISTYVKNFIRHCYNFSHIFNCHTYFKELNRRILVYLYLNSDLKFNHYLTFVLLWRFQVSIWYNFLFMWKTSFSISFRAVLLLTNGMFSFFLSSKNFFITPLFLKDIFDRYRSWVHNFFL